MTVGVLALQGCVDPHLEMLKKIGVEGKKILTAADLAQVDRLIMPGGESTTMLKLLNLTGLFTEIKSFAKKNPVWGICAGAILCAKEVVNPSQQSLGIVGIRAHRNFYGSQLDSFKTSIEVRGFPDRIDVDFIRAPRLEPIDPDVEVLAKDMDGTPLLMQQGHCLVSAFHTELGTSTALHKYFTELKR